MVVKMKVLVACEFSATVREAFTAAGHEAMSCDLLPSEIPGNHYQGSVLDVLTDGWDLMIAHPPCTYLSNSGAGHMYLGKGKEAKAALGYTVDPQRWQYMEEAAAFFSLLLAAPIPRIAIENPRMHGWGIERTGGRAHQVIQPWEYGHGETKATGLRLKNLPYLMPTEIVTGRDQRIWKMPPGENRKRERSRTYAGIAAAMAEQWGALPPLPAEPSAADTWAQQLELFETAGSQW